VTVSGQFSSPPPGSQMAVTGQFAVAANTQARPVRTREHRIKHDTRMLDRPQRPVGA